MFSQLFLVYWQKESGNPSGYPKNGGTIADNHFNYYLHTGRTSNNSRSTSAKPAPKWARRPLVVVRCTIAKAKVQQEHNCYNGGKDAYIYSSEMLFILIPMA